jgi:hypothetical protein
MPPRPDQSDEALFAAYQAGTPGPSRRSSGAGNRRCIRGAIGTLADTNQRLIAIYNEANAIVAAGQMTLERLEAFLSAARQEVDRFNGALGQVSTDLGSYNRICGNVRTGVIVAGVVAAAAVTIWVLVASAPGMAVGGTAATGSTTAVTAGTAANPFIMGATQAPVVNGTMTVIGQSGLQTVVRVNAINGSRAQVVRLAGNGVEVGRSFWTYLARPGTYGIPLP